VHPLAHQFFSIQLVNGIIGVSVVIELHKSKAVLHQDLSDPSISFEELLDVSFPDIVRQSPHIYSGSHGLNVRK